MPLYLRHLSFRKLELKDLWAIYENSPHPCLKGFCLNKFLYLHRENVNKQILIRKYFFKFHSFLCTKTLSHNNDDLKLNDRLQNIESCL